MKKIILIITLSLFTTGIKAQTTMSNQFADYVEWLQTSEPKLSGFIKEWLGVRYRLGGSTKRGIDCSQFSKKLYLNVYGKRLGENCAAQWKQTKRVLKDSLITGDIIFFRSRQSPSGWHCGIYIGDNRFVHAANKHEGVKISSLQEPKYIKGYKGSGRLN